MNHTLRSATAALLLAGTAGLASTAQAANDVLLTPAASSVLPGASVQFALSGQGFADLMLGGGLSLQWDPAVLAFDSGAVDATTWEFARSIGQLDAAAGTLTGMYFASFNGRTGDFAIASLRFNALQPGSSAIAMSLFPSQPFANALGEVVDVDLAGATVTVVPEPASWLMMALAGLLVPLARRRAQRA